MKTVEAIQNFEHGATRRRGEQFGVSEQHAEALERAGLARVVGDQPDEPAEPAATPAPQGQPITSPAAKPRGRAGKPTPAT